MYFWNKTLQVSDSKSVLHKESSTVHSALGTGHIEISKLGKITSNYWNYKNGENY